MRVLVTACLFALSSVVSGGQYSAELIITHVPMYSNGSEFPRSDVDYYEICVGINDECDSLHTTIDNVAVLDNVLSSNQTLNFKTRVYDKSGVVSDWSNVITKTVLMPAPPRLDSVRIVFVAEQL